MDKSVQTHLTWLQESPVLLKASIGEQDEQTPSEPDYGSVVPVTGDERNQEEDTKDKSEDALDTGPVPSLTDMLGDASDDSTTDDANSDNEDVSPGASTPPPPYTSLPKTNLPWPTILQYLRESESESSKYFSLDHSSQPESVAQPSSSSSNSEHHQCHFCGKVPYAFSLISLTSGEQIEEPKFCCPEYRDYTILVAAYTKQMLDAKLNHRPGKVFIKNQRVRFKKTAQERAYDRVRRKRKWEETKEKRAKMLQSSSVYSLARQTQIIHFSLSSGTCINAGWTQHPDDVKKQELQAKPKKLQLPQSVDLQLPNNIIEQLPNIQTAEVGQLQMERYSSGHPSVLLLPDRTGQYYYPSGNVAVQIFLIYPQIKAYFLFEDIGKGLPIGYIDELGRGWLCNNKNSLRFVNLLDQCYMFDGLGKIKHWYWNDTSTYSLWLPIVFKLNLHLAIRYSNQDNVQVSLSACQQQNRLNISRIYTQLSNKNVDKVVENYKVQLEKLRYRFNCHLSSLEKASKLVKLEQSRALPPVISQHRKTRSTGPIVLHKT